MGQPQSSIMTPPEPRNGESTVGTYWSFALTRKQGQEETRRNNME